MLGTSEVLQLEEQLHTLIRKHTALPMPLALKDICSEASRLAGLWILEKDPRAIVHVYRGDRVLHSQGAHDVLFLEREGYILDPTVRQFFPKRKSMLIAICDKKELLSALSSTYGGEWQFSETLTLQSYREKDLEEVIVQSLQE